MEEDILWTERMLKDRVDGSNRAAKVLDVKSNGDVDQRRVAYVTGESIDLGSTFFGITEHGGSTEGEEAVVGCRWRP